MQTYNFATPSVNSHNTTSIEIYHVAIWKIFPQMACPIEMLSLCVLRILQLI